MSKAIDETRKQEALVVINQVGYNTTYTIDFLKDGQGLVQEKIYRAQEIEVSPGSFEINDGDGACPLVGSQDFLEDSGSKTNLGFNLRVTCNPVQITDYEKGATYPTGVKLNNAANSDAVNSFFYAEMQGRIPIEGSYVYVDVSANTGSGRINFRAEGFVSLKGGNAVKNRYVGMSSVNVTSYTSSGSAWSNFNFRD